MLTFINRSCLLLCYKSRNLSSFSTHRFFIASATNFTVQETQPSPILLSRLSFWKGINLRPLSHISFISTSASLSSSPAVNQVLLENEVQQAKLLSAINDDHGGLIVEMNEAMDSGTFASMLRASISHWKEQGKKGVWIKIPIEQVNLVEAAVKEGFLYHHAEPEYLMLAYWIPESANILPANASHRVGIGAFVMNEKGKVLVVQENSGKLRGTGFWKFPTGVVEEGEDISTAAVREVKEETGIDSEFVEILAFRQSHQSFFGKSDLFFMCVLRPLSFNIEKQESEIAAAEWIPFEDYAAQHFVQRNELLTHIVDICSANRDHKYSGFSPVLTSSFSGKKKNNLYLNNRDFNSF